MLKRRAKHRYLCMLFKGESIDAITLIKKRHLELFGAIATERADIRLIRSEDNSLAIIRCRLEQIDSVLASSSLTEKPMLTLGMSGTLKQLRKSINNNCHNW